MAVVLAFALLGGFFYQLMLLPFPAIDAAFKAASPRDVAILFLIEDSSAMGLLWPRLRDFYLPKVLAAIKDANPSVTVSYLHL